MSATVDGNNSPGDVPGMAASLAEFLSAYPQTVQEIALAARALVLDVFPGALEMVDAPSRIVAYGTDATYAGLVFAIAPQQKYANLMFARGASLPDPAGLLEGTGKKARHVKLRSPADAARPEIRALLETALRLHLPAR